MSTEALNQLIEEYARKFQALDDEFHIKATAFAWGMAATALTKGLTDTLPLLTNGRKKRVSDDPRDAIDTVNLTKRSSKRDRFAVFLENRSGKWFRRDSDNVYVCQGPADTSDHFLMHKVGDNSSRTITVSLVSLLSKWNHLP